MLNKKRKGVALITVVLISALILVSIAGIVIKVIPENKIIAANSSSQRALSAAETGLSQAIFNLRNANFENNTTAPDSSMEYIAPAEKIKNIADAATNTVFTFSERAVPSDESVPYVTYQVKIKKTGETAGSGEGEETDTLNILSMGTVYDNSTSKKPLARKVISTTYEIGFAKTKTTSYTVDFGILAGGNIDFRGNSSENNGDIFANGNITSEGNNTRVNGGEAYGTESSKIDSGVASETHTGLAPIDIPAMFSGYKKELASSFKTGAAPYDGSSPGYPNTTDPLVQSVINGYLPGTSNTLTQIHSFYSDLLDHKGGFLSLTNPQYSNLLDNEKNIAYYINDNDVKITDKDSFIKDDIKNYGFVRLGGIIFIDGDLDIEGNTTIGYLNKLDLTFVVSGTVTIKTTGTAAFNGLIYAKGGVDFDVGGTFDLNGSVITEGSVTLKGGGAVNFYPMGINQQPVEEFKITVNANIKENSWKEISYEEFLTP